MNPDTPTYYYIMLHREGQSPYELGTVPSLDDLFKWFQQSVSVIPYLMRPRWEDEVRVISYLGGERVKTFRLGWVEVEPLEKEQAKSLIEVVQ